LNLLGRKEEVGSQKNARAWRWEKGGTRRVGGKKCEWLPKENVSWRGDQVVGVSIFNRRTKGRKKVCDSSAKELQTKT